MKNEYLMIGWSGADWRVANPLIDQGLMPQLANIVNNGVIGSLTGFAPQVAPMLWKTIATGKHPHQHNVSGATKEDTCRCGSIWQLAASQSLPAQAIAWPFPQGDVFPKGRDDLADLLKPTEPQCSVFIVSAHGRPDSVATRRNSGIFAVAGRGIKRDESVHALKEVGLSSPTHRAGFCYAPSDQNS